MKRFRDDNTHGYSSGDLENLNQLFDKASAGITDLDALDHVAERILADYDTEHSATE